jgi:hypothetical protein
VQVLLLFKGEEMPSVKELQARSVPFGIDAWSGGVMLTC